MILVVDGTGDDPMIPCRREIEKRGCNIRDWAPIMFSIPQGPRRLLIALAAMIGTSPFAGGFETCSSAALGANRVARCSGDGASSPIDGCRPTARDEPPSLAFEPQSDGPAGGCSCRSRQPHAPIHSPNSGTSHKSTNPSVDAVEASAPPSPARQTAVPAHLASAGPPPGLSLYLWTSRFLN